MEVDGTTQTLTKALREGYMRVTLLEIGVEGLGPYAGPWCQDSCSLPAPSRGPLPIEGGAARSLPQQARA